MQLTLTASLLALLNAVQGHIVMKSPAPFVFQVAGHFNPLEPDGSDFPCKIPPGGRYQDPAGGATQMAIGQPQTISFAGVPPAEQHNGVPPNTAVHGGGSCQLAITEDPRPTKATVWKVIHSIEGGCPARHAAGNLPAGASPDTYQFTIPQGIAPGKYTFAWVWLNRIGQAPNGVPEIYMNCAPIVVTSGGGGAGANTATNKGLDVADKGGNPAAGGPTKGAGGSGPGARGNNRALLRRDPIERRKFYARQARAPPAAKGNKPKAGPGPVGQAPKPNPAQGGAVNKGIGVAASGAAGTAAGTSPDPDIEKSQGLANNLNSGTGNPAPLPNKGAAGGGFPDLYRANLGGVSKGCVTLPANRQQLAVAYPNPGPSVDRPNGAAGLWKSPCDGSPNAGKSTGNAAGASTLDTTGAAGASSGNTAAASPSSGTGQATDTGASSQKPGTPKAGGKDKPYTDEAGTNSVAASDSGTGEPTDSSTGGSAGATGQSPKSGGSSPAPSLASASGSASDPALGGPSTSEDDSISDPQLSQLGNPTSQTSAGAGPADDYSQGPGGQAGGEDQSKPAGEKCADDKTGGSAGSGPQDSNDADSVDSSSGSTDNDYTDSSTSSKDIKPMNSQDGPTGGKSAGGKNSTPIPKGGKSGKDKPLASNKAGNPETQAKGEIKPPQVSGNGAKPKTAATENGSLNLPKTPKGTYSKGSNASGAKSMN